MNVFFVTNAKLSRDTSAGGDFYLLDLINGLSKLQFSIYLIFPDNEKSDYLYLRKYDKYGKYQEIDIPDNSNAEDNFKEILERFECDIIHFQHFQTLPLSLMEIAKELNKKLVITIHDYFLWCENFFLLSPLKGNIPSFCSFEQDKTFCTECLKASKELRQLIYGRIWKDRNFSEEYVEQRRSYINRLLCCADLLISPTEYVRDRFLSVYPSIDPSRFVVIEHGVLKGINRSEKYSHTDSEKLKVAFLGGFKYEKGSVYFHELLKAVIDERIEFYIIGNVSYPIETKYFKNLKVLGGYKREELSDILMREGMDLIVLLSPWAETFSYTLSEAIINEIPVIATDIGAFRERIAKYGVGFLVPYENPVPRIAGLINDLADNPKILEFFKNNCIVATNSLKAVETMITEYAELYKKISLET